MSLYVASLNSGSNGNCYYVGNDTEAVLIDAGISCRETERRMLRLGLSMHKVKAIFITHEHSDHIYGLASLSNKYRLPVYITVNTLQNSGLFLEPYLVMSFSAGESVIIGKLAINAFKKFHDASDPHSFVVSCNKIRVGIFTDIGKVCPRVIYHFKQCNAAILEANYDDNMLAAGSYPYHLKRRISGDRGHLSNTDALQLFNTHKPKFMSHLVLGHLSKNNNCPKLVQQLFYTCAGKTNIIVASRYQETPVFHVSEKNSAGDHTGRSVIKPVSSQLSLFE